MATMHIVKNNNFSIVSNAIIRDTSLSLKARGLFILMLSLPETWEFSVRGLSKITGEGVDAIRSGLQELEKQGYLVRQRKRNAEGKLGDMEYTLYEEPQQKPEQNEPTKGLPTKSKPIQENPIQANSTQINKDIKQELNIASTERENNSVTVYEQQGKLFSLLGSRLLPTEQARIQNEYFQRFWLMYPRKAKQLKAQFAWNALPFDAGLYEQILKAVERYSKSRQWQDKMYVPYPENFLDGRRWEDDIPEDVPAKKNDVTAAAAAVVAGLDEMEW